MAFFHEGGRRPQQPILNAPASVLWLIAVILVAHAAREFASSGMSREWIYTYGFIPERYVESLGKALSPEALAQQFLPFVSYMFVHADFGHAGINCLWLLAFGPMVALRLGTLRFYIFFLFCGVVAAMAHLAANWGSDMPAVGASGAISGMMAAAIRIYYGAHGTVFRGRSGLAPIWSRQVVFFTLIWSALNILGGMTGIGVPSSGPVYVAWVAHLGGYFAGLLFLDIFDMLGFRRRMS